MTPQPGSTAESEGEQSCRRPEGTRARPPNVTDAWRFLAAFCIVWYHSAFLAVANEGVVPSIRLSLINWSLPFFYVTAAYFAFAKFRRCFDPSPRAAWQALLRRVGRLLQLVLIYTVIYELPRALRYGLSFVLQALERGPLPSLSQFLGSAGTVTYVPFGLDPSDPAPVPVQLLHTVRWANNSPVYFLVDLALISAICFVGAHAFRRVRTPYQWVAGVACLIVATIARSPAQAAAYQGIGLHWSLVSWPLVAIGAALLKGEKVRTGRSTHAAGMAVPLLLLPILLCAALWQARSGSWLNPWLLRLPLVAVYVLFVIVAIEHIQVRGTALSALSRWGQNYSLGIFLWHGFWFRVYNWFSLPKVMSALGLDASSLGHYLLVNLAAFLLAWGTTHLAKRTIPALVAI